MADQKNSFQVVNNFTKGMNKDLDNSLRSSDMYYDAEDLRLVVNDKGEYGALKNYNGIADNTLNLGAGQLICGTIAIRNELIIFTTDGTDSHIYKATLNDDGVVTACILLYDDSQNVDATNLSFSTEYKIKGVGRYESSTVKKVYWVDGLNKIRFANVAGYLTDDGLAVDTNNGISVNQMEFVQDASLPILTLDSVINGDITSGIIQYAYQFYNLNGSESLISEFTHPIHVTPASEQELTDVKYGGADSNVFTGKGFKLKLEHSNLLFDRIRLIAIEYKTLNGSPTIRIVEEKVINEDDNIYFYDSGNSVGELTFEEATIERGGLFIAEDIEVKDNILFAANITDETFDIDNFDARAYRFSGDSVTPGTSNYNISFLKTHTSADDATVLTDSTANWADKVGQNLQNIDSGLSGTVTSNDTTTATCEVTHEDTIYDISAFTRVIANASGYANLGGVPNVLQIYYTEQILYDVIKVGDIVTVALTNYNGDYEVVGVGNDPNYYIQIEAADNGEPSGTIEPKVIVGYRTLVTHAAGTLVDGESYEIADTTYYDGTWIIRKISSTSFAILETWAATETGHVIQPNPNTYLMWDHGDKYIFGEDGNTRSRIYDETGNYYEGYGDTTTGTWTGSGLSNVNGWANIPPTFDAINPYNDDSNDQNYSDRFIYQSDGKRLGGSGPNISYVFKIQQQIIDNNVADAINYESNFTSYADPKIDNENRGYARDEVYRFAIVFKDGKGRRSYPKWIADIRMPKVSDRDTGDGITTYGTSNDFATFVEDTEIYANILYPEFTVNNAPYDYEIVRVKRESGDRSILGQGININTESVIIDGITQNVPKGYHPGSTGSYGGGTKLDSAISGILRFFSPEVSFNKNLIWGANDYIEVVGEVDAYSEKNLGTNYTWTYKDKNLIPLGTYYNIQLADHVHNVLDGQVVSMSDGIVVIDSTNYSAYADITAAENPTITISPEAAADASFYSGVSFVYHLDNVPSNTLFTDAIHITNYKRPVYGVQYGGNTYNARSLNNYIRCSNIILAATTTVSCYGGDTFIGMFGVLVSVFDLSRTGGWVSNNNSISETIYVPVETSINLNLRHDNHLSRISSIDNVALLQEVAGNHADSDSPINTLVQDTDLYLYNTVYSQDNIVNTYFAEPIDFTENTSFDTRILNSQVKISGETSDSWTKFLVNDYIEVDAKCGPVNNIKLYNNKLFFFQDHGFGVVSVNERSLIADNNPGQLVLGTGGVLERYDYMSQNIGNTNKFGLTLSPRGLYWIDNSKRDIYRFSDSLSALASTKGMKSFLNSYRSIDDVVSGYDTLYEEVLFTIQGSTPATIITKTGAGPYDYTIRGKDVNLFRLNVDKKYLRVGSQMTIADKLATTPASSTYPSQVTVTTATDLGAQDATINLYFNNTLCFAETGDVFSEFKSSEPFMYVDSNYNLMSVYSTAAKLGTHNMNTRGKYYTAGSDIYSESKLSILVNDKYPYTKVYDSLGFATNTIDSNNLNVYTDTFNKIRFRNDYQNTDWKTMTYHTMASTFDSTAGQLGYNRRESYFTTPVPRNIVDIVPGTVKDIYLADNLDLTQTYKDRIRGNHMIVDFKYLTDASTKIDYDFSVSYIKTNYRLSFR